MSKKVISATRTKGAATSSSAARTKGKSHLPSYDKYIKNQSGSAEEEALLDVISALTSQSQPVSAVREHILLDYHFYL